MRPAVGGKRGLAGLFWGLPFGLGLFFVSSLVSASPVYLDESYQVELPGSKDQAEPEPRENREPAQHNWEPPERHRRQQEEAPEESSFGEGPDLSFLGEVMMWVFIAAAALVLLTFLVMAIKQRQRGTDDEDLDEEEEEEELDEEDEALTAEEVLEELGMEVATQEHEDLAAQERYSEAVHALLLAVLRVQIARATVRIRASHTAHELSALLSLDEPLQMAFEALLRGAESAHFGMRRLGQSDYLHFRGISSALLNESEAQ